MLLTATSFEVDGEGLDAVRHEVVRALGRVRNPAGCLLFLSGSLASNLEGVASELRRVIVRPPMLLAAGAGVLTERREIEGRSAATGLVWSGGPADLVAVQGTDEDEAGEALARCLLDRTAKNGAPVLAFVNAQFSSGRLLEPLRDLHFRPNLFGAGTIGEPGAVGLEPDGTLLTGPLLLMIPRGIGQARLGTARSCRVLGPLLPITEVREQQVLRLDERPTLDVLGALGAQIPRDSPLMVVLSREKPREETPGDLLVRPVRGVDPSRGALTIHGDVREGMYLGFAVVDAGVARQDLDVLGRQLTRELAGAVPRFGVYLHCAHRGSKLFGMPAVDVRVLGQHLPRVPFAGMMSSFELGAQGGRPEIQHFTGLFGLFTAGS